MAGQPLIQSPKGVTGADLPRQTQRNRAAAPVQGIGPANIMRQAFMKNGSNPAQAEKLVSQMAGLIKKGKVKPVQIGNTVFLFFPKGPGEAEIHITSVEPPDVLVSRMKTVAATAKSIGLKKLTTFFFDPSFVRMAQATGLPVKITQSQQNTRQGMRPAYKLEVAV